MKDDLESIKEFHKDNTVHFVLRVANLQKIEKSEGIEKRFKLTSTISCNNFVLFDKDYHIKRYNNEVEILEEFFDIRYDFYVKRREFLLRKLKREYETLKNKVSFIESIASQQI